MNITNKLTPRILIPLTAALAFTWPAFAQTSDSGTGTGTNATSGHGIGDTTGMGIGSESTVPGPDDSDFSRPQRSGRAGRSTISEPFDQRTGTWGTSHDLGTTPGFEIDGSTTGSGLDNTGTESDDSGGQ